jgi:hypothetical protein
MRTEPSDPPPSLSDMRTLSAILVAAALAVLPALPAHAAAGDDERITSYDVDLAVQPDGSMRVRETIAYDFGSSTGKHGIEREIDTQQKFDGKHDRQFPVSGVTASPGPVEVTGTGALTTVRIGDPDQTVSGTRTYTVTYTVAAATTRFDDHDELYWNAVGPDWSVPVEDVTVRVSGAQVTRSQCFAGDPGGTDACGSAEGGSFRQSSLAAGQVLTVVTAFPAGTVATAQPILVDRKTLGRYFAGNPLVAVPGVLVALGGPILFLVRTLRRRTAREAPGLPYRRQFQPQPPAGMRPLLANMLLHGAAKPADTVAVLLDLSARGFVSVTQAGKNDWRLTALRTPDASVPPEGREVFQAAFGDGPETTLKKAAKPLRKVQARLAGMAKDGVVDQGWYAERPGTSHAGGWMALAIVMFLAGIPVTFAAAFFLKAAVIGPALLVGGIVLLVAASLRSTPRTEAGEIARSQLMAFESTLRGIDPGRLPADQRDGVLAAVLPYAVVLGLAPALATAFSAAGVVAGGYAYATNPLWWSTFSTDAVRSTTPSSSSGGGSGFSGGSAGGGGGGGGGGSW